MDDKKLYIYKKGSGAFEQEELKPNIPLVFAKKIELKQALNTMYNAWIPLNEVVYNAIKKKVVTRVYDNNRIQFIQDISTDFTILSLIFKEMPNIITSRESIDPVKFLKTCDIEELKKIFLKDAAEYSYHSFDNMQDAEAVIYKYTAISTQISQKFAMLNNQDPLWIYVISVLRGLANCLIAWNYPRLFDRALKMQTMGKEKLDDFIERTIGFSPNDLIVELVLGWNFNDKVRDLVDVTRSSNYEDLVSKCIDNAEMIAKFYEPKIFPDAINRLDDFKTEISDTNVSNVIKKEVAKACSYYQQFAPEIFDLTMSIKDKIKEAILAHADNKLRKNTFIFQCDDDIVKSFKKVYVNMTDDKFSKRALEILRYDTISKAGFNNGCLYIYNEERDTLIPTLKIGERELYKYTEIPCKNNHEYAGVIVDTLKCAVPIKYQGVSITGEIADFICASFGDTSKRGVLYLEYVSDNEGLFDDEMLIKFKAIHRCLNECLGFSSN